MEERRKFIQLQCLVGQPAFCTAECPFQFNVPDFAEKIQRGGFSAAYRAYRNAVVFPGIVSQLCSAPCKRVCPRARCDAALDMPMLERAAVAYASNLRPNSYNVPPKKHRIAVIGAGISGLTCALRLASSKYEVTVYEKSGRVGGHLWEKLPREKFLPEIELAFSLEKYNLLPDTQVFSLETIAADAVYVATGADGSDFEFERGTGLITTSRPGLFLGGALCGSDSVQAIADGLCAVTLIESYLKTGTMTPLPERRETRVQIAPERLRYVSPVVAESGGEYSIEEASAEAKRCLRCSCDACRRHCDLMTAFNKFPNRLADEVYFTVYPASLFAGETFAKRLIGSCTQCGACKDACPIGLDVGELLIEGRRALHRRDKLPWVFHQFWLDDMAHAMSDASSVCRNPLGMTSAKAAFFPGCQLGASDIRYVLESYRWLLSQSDVALWLSCCGVPAVWSGDEELSRRTLESLREDWERLGRPELIFACPTCKKNFERYLPELKGCHLVEYMEKHNFSPRRNLAGERFSVFDPCSVRNDPSPRKAARTLAHRAEADLEALTAQDEAPRCCSWGGHMSIANPNLADDQIKNRIEQSLSPYITYCANCRDIFADAGKSCVHLLDILFDLGDVHRPSPDCTQRRKNRELLKRQALLEFWKEESALGDQEDRLIIDEALRKKMSGDRILAKNVIDTIDFCERTGRTVTDPETGAKTGYAVIGHVTFWVTYRSEGERLRLLNAYGHRMSIQVEETWNGKKVDDDL